MPDVWVQCRCGAQFVFTEGEQKFFAERRMTPPRRCRNCRAAREQGQQTREERIAHGAPQTGVVKRYDATHGYGFIRSDGREIFFHIRALYKTKPAQIRAGAAVEFCEIESVRRPDCTCAEHVTVIEGENQ